MTDIPPRGSRAALRSPKLDASPDEQRCLGFYYYMDKAKFGILRVYLISEENIRQLLWETSQDHGRDWVKAEVSYNTTGEAWEYIEIEAERGPLRDGDIGIDDVVLSGVSCEILHRPGKHE